MLAGDPQRVNVDEEVTKNGIDIVLALDVSKSMEAQDLQPNRMQAAKKVLSDFTSTLSSDRIGLVVFAGKPYASVPLSFDYAIIEETLEKLTTDSLNQQVQ